MAELKGECYHCDLTNVELFKTDKGNLCKYCKDDIWKYRCKSCGKFCIDEKKEAPKYCGKCCKICKGEMDGDIFNRTYCDDCDDKLEKVKNYNRSEYTLEVMFDNLCKKLNIDKESLMDDNCKDDNLWDEAN